ncbi:MAG: hypothetical protein RRC07_16615 [Anaerolineae bacterium]|nr:hypothetical protein [Anaerolineae bacterium]
MVSRLSDLYQPGDHVEILLANHWRPGQVLAAQHPGLWVQSAGQRWFVTNRRHIRPAATPRPPAGPR